MDPISGTLKALFRELYEKEDGSKIFNLSFTMNGKPFTSKFKASCESVLESSNPEKTTSYLFGLQLLPRQGDISKSCISIRNSELYDDGIDSYIKANSTENGCFTPVLKTNKSNTNASLHYTATDVLQILKTKLCLLIPTKYPITLNDMARVDAVLISSFRILHRQPALYEKYGYISPNLNVLRKVLETIRIRDIEDRTMPELGLSFKALLEELVKREIHSDEKLLDVYSSVTFEDENKFNKEHQIYSESLVFSYQILNIIINIKDLDDWTVFTLNPVSEAWRTSDAKLQFTDFKEVSEESTTSGGGGRRIRSRTRRRNYRIRRHKISRKNLLIKTKN